MTGELLLTFNAGSSTLKIGIYELQPHAAEPVGRGKIDFDAEPLRLTYSIDSDRYERELSGNHASGFDEVIAETLDHLLSHLPGKLAAAAHRVVHGGLEFKAPVVLTESAIARIRALTPLAPLHQPAALRVIDALKKSAPDLRQTASFDTAFHSTQAALTQRLAIPRKLHDSGVRRYGFHGLSYRYIAGRMHDVAPDLAKEKLLVAHLGSGASVCAIENGESRDCSMGFSALDGIPMATRPGWIDPGALLYLMRNGLSDPQELEDFLYHDCGLLGVSGIDGDTRALLDDKRPEAAEAIDLFCFRIAGEVARQAVTLQGIDALVFTAGIGENQPVIRRKIVQHLAWLGLRLDPAANGNHSTLISDAESKVGIYVIPTDEEKTIADEAFALLSSQTKEGRR